VGHLACRRGVCFDRGGSMIRVESANILRAMLAHGMAMTNTELVAALGLTLASVNRRTLALHNQRHVGMEARYVPGHGLKRGYVHFLWVTSHGKQALEAYEERRKERPTVAAKNPVARGKKAPVQRAKVANSVFNWGTR